MVWYNDVGRVQPCEASSNGFKRDPFMPCFADINGFRRPAMRPCKASSCGFFEDKK